MTKQERPSYLSTRALLPAAASLVLLVAAGCDPDPGDARSDTAQVERSDLATASDAAEPGTSEPGDPEPALAPPLAAPPLDQVDPQGPWRELVSARVEAIAAARPEFHGQLEKLEPARARDGSYRYRGAWMEDPDAGPVFLLRLLDEKDPDFRLELAELLPRLRGVPPAALFSLAAADPDPRLRRVLVAELWRLRSSEGRDALAAALEDPSAPVRAAAAVAAARHPEGPTLASGLAALLADADPDVRRLAARSVGAVGSEGELTALAPLLGDADPEVRLTSLRALSRIDPDRARQLATAHALASDPDPRVARAATKLGRQLSGN